MSVPGEQTVERGKEPWHTLTQPALSAEQERTHKRMEEVSRCNLTKSHKSLAWVYHLHLITFPPSFLLLQKPPSPQRPRDLLQLAASSWPIQTKGHG